MSRNQIILVIFGTAYILAIVNCTHPSFGTIAGNKTSSECINGGLLSTSELDMTTTELIKREGYTAEEHVVLTDDGYYLTMHRIPGKLNATPVLVQHGMMCSSYDWVVNGKNKSLAFILADHGYDVWLGNFRGNTYSRCHVKYDTSQSEYWNFSWHELGVYDVPAKVAYITNITNKNILYIGHSMATTASYVTAIERPDIASRINALFSLAPVAYNTHGQSIYLSFTDLLHQNGLLSRETEFLPLTPTIKGIIKDLCFGSLVQRKLCMNTLFIVLGFGLPTPYYAAMHYYMMTPKILSHFPAGAATKAVAHYVQVRKSDCFQYFDYGSEENLRRYGNSTPPEYDISKITLPVGLFWAGNDAFVHPVDVTRLSKILPNRILDYKVELPEFNHIDFMYAAGAYEHCYSKLLSTMEDFR